MTIAITFPKESSMINFAAAKLLDTMRELGIEADIGNGEDSPRASEASVQVIIVSSEAEAQGVYGLAIDRSVAAEGFEIRREPKAGTSVLYVLARDEAGAMYGTLELAERLQLSGELSAVSDCVMNARFPFRAVKFNLPWSTYRRNECFELQRDTVRDLAFWQRFLDAMAVNRYNVLTLWNLHPFPYMVRTPSFPKACPFTDEELAEWKQYWTALFRMAKARGIETYMVDWNIFVSEAFREHYDPQAISDDTFYHYGDSYSTEQIMQYTRESVSQLIEEYPDLTGLGISLGERMNDMTPEDRQEWIKKAYFEPIEQAKRPVKFIHRAPFSVDPSVTREAIEASDAFVEPVWVEIKFNWSHAYSSPRLLLTHGGSQGMEGYWKPMPERYKITWMVRNEDFFTLRWAQPDFIRDHIAANGQDYVGGYYIGSECMIPGMDYSHEKNSAHKNWTYLFEKNWLYYMLWGRLLYDPATPDRIFEHALDRRHGAPVGSTLLKAYASVCKFPMALASLYSFTWDFTLYAEGFLSTNESEYDDGAAFISLQDLLARKTFDPAYLSVSDYADLTLRGESTDSITPLQLADGLEADANRGLELLKSMTNDNPEFCCEKADIEAWACLNLYLADKLRAGVAFALFQRTGREEERLKALRLLEAPNAASHWDRLVAVTQSHYVEHPLMHLGNVPFSWQMLKPQVLADIALVANAKP